MRSLTLLAAGAAVGALVALASGPAAAAPQKATGVTLMASLSGSVEVPPGDADGTGSFKGRLNVGQGKLCYTLTSAKLGTLTMAHIHAGKAGVAGPPVVSLKPDAPSETCMDVAKDVAQKIVSAPDDYYVNVHTSDHPAGAIRGQLMKR